MRMLLEMGADVNAKTIHGETAISCAKKMHLLEVVEELRKAGAYEEDMENSADGARSVHDGSRT